MQSHIPHRTSTTASIVFDVLNPIPFGLFVGALVFDAAYARSADILWVKSAAWLICGALVVAIVPRLIDLARVWLTPGRTTVAYSKVAFWLNAGAIVAGIVNAFVHSRDAYGVMPDGLWLSVLTVALLIAANVVATLRDTDINTSTSANTNTNTNTAWSA